MRNFSAVFMAAALLTVTAAQAASEAPSPLAPGKPAGLRHAQDDSVDPLFYIIGAGAIAAGIALIASDSSNNNNSGSTAAATTTTK